MRRKLANNDGHGDVAMCGRCQDVHIRWDNLMLSLSREQFEEFSRMITSARSGLSQEVESAPKRTGVSGAWVQ